MKLGMVFEGGASRTIFSCGVADAFLEENIMPDYFIGVSAGIAFGLSYLSKCQINYCPLIMMHLQHFRDRWKQQ